MELTAILGEGYDSLIEAKVDKSPDELVVTNNNETFYIVSVSNYENTLASKGYNIVVNTGE
ncbi:hypothetical protein [Alkalihalobacterium alkalinitrilicum]|uniref:hypothetical protein n=1 Tax=Alkalihalobacterium alkalinitrilicum TaxID=427920 RepID=UPI000995B9CE|nr:hypothetical protein [Alkalihalobacterium alkalinitrilicum]